MRLTTLETGARLGVYEVTAPLGAGGMGEVYRARDTRLGRDVALKVLAGEFAGDAGRKARFEDEARSVAALNHPNILAIYDVGLHGGVAFMVTELVEGESLREAALPLRKAIDVAAQVADGLAAAHAAGVTHRDVKPDNVMITRDGRAKILDFGLAKAADAAGSAETRLQTEAGTVVGTVAYMAPEQVRGGPVDPRTDVFAFGVTLYELVAGRRPFDGETPAEIMTAILRQEPPALPAHVPPAVRQIVERCLEKRPEERFQSSRDLAFALRHLSHASGAMEIAGAEPGPGKRARRWGLAAAFAAGAALAGASALYWAAGRDAGVDPVQVTRIAGDRMAEIEPALSPDGRSVAYLRLDGRDATELLVKEVGALTPATLVRSERPLASPRWTPDGNRVCYTSQGDLFCVGAAGGTPQRLLSSIFRPQFAPDGRSVYTLRPDERDNLPYLFRVPLDGGAPERVGDSSVPTDTEGISPVSPDGAAMIVFGRTSREALALAGGARRVLPVDPGVRTVSVAWMPDSRHIAVAEDTTDPVSSRLVIADTQGPARRLVVRGIDPLYAVTASPDGTRLAYSSGPVVRDIVEHAADGRFVRTVAASSSLEGFVSWMPDGRRFVYRVGGPGQSSSFWMGHADGQPATPVMQLGTSLASGHRISPDGGRIAYADGSGVHVFSSTGGRAVRLVPPLGLTPRVCWSADGDWVWYGAPPVPLRRVSSQGGEPITTEATPGTLLDCSPDGRWLARVIQGFVVLTSTDGAREVRLAKADEVATGASGSSVFGQEGKVLYLLARDRRSIVTLDAESGRSLRTVSFELPAEDAIMDYAVSPDGTRVLLTIGGSRDDLWMAEGFPLPARGWRRWFQPWEAPTAPGRRP